MVVSASERRTAVSAALGVLRSSGERQTPARRAVLDVLAGTDDHLTADEIVTRAERGAPGVHRATVYRALATLGEVGIITHTHLGGSASVYHLTVPAPRAAAPHSHVQCTVCTAVFDVPVEKLQPLADWLDLEIGFSLAPQHTALLGVCGSCRETADRVDDPHPHPHSH